MKGEWIIERSSGYLGYRCLKCGTWKYDNERLRCDCDKKRCMNSAPKKNFKPKKSGDSQK